MEEWTIFVQLPNSCPFLSLSIEVVRSAQTFIRLEATCYTPVSSIQFPSDSEPILRMHARYLLLV